MAFNDGSKVYNLTADHIDGISSEDRIALCDHIDARARQSFQFVYNTFRIDEARDAGFCDPALLFHFLDFLNTPVFLDFARAVTGCRDIAFADAQATMFRGGHFLTQHTDDVKGKNRRAAYVFNFTPKWRADWGGILTFTDRDGHVVEGYTPTYNALNIFRVPQPHLVSYVTPFAGAARLSITGWLRAD